MARSNDSHPLAGAARAAIDRTWPEGTAPEREEIVFAMAELLAMQIAAERARWVEACRSRAELWRSTPSATASAAPLAREEARARANEAAYLADIIESASGLDKRPLGDPDEAN